MTDDDFDKIDEDFADEFDFIEDDSAGGDTGTNSGSPSPQNKFSSGMIIKIVIGIVVIGGGFAAYKFLTSSSEQTPVAETTAPLPAPVEEVTVTEVTAEVVPEDNSNLDGAIDFAGTSDQLPSAVPENKSFAQVQKDLKTAAKPAAIPDEINATLDSISEEMTLNVNQIKQLESTITSLAGTLDQLNKSISAMDNRVLSLTETVDGLAQDLSNVKKIMMDEDLDITNPSTLKFSPKTKAPALNASTPDYTVHAIIPGRAWLKSASGQIITVTEGDKVGDYGTVAVIDAANGLVRTSSGITFK